MSRIDELIRELCPEGVPFFRLDEVFDVKGGFTPSKSEAKFWMNGTIPWFRMEDIRDSGRILDSSTQSVSAAAAKSSGTFEADSIIISTSATIGEHALITVPFLANQRFSVLTRKSEFHDSVDPKFAFYVGFELSQYCKEKTSVSSFAKVVMPAFKAFLFPVPPLKVQREIVSILDKFTQLEAELEAELKTRRTQYAVTRDRLLDFSGNLSAHPMGELIRELCPGGVPIAPLGKLADLTWGNTSITKSSYLDSNRGYVAFSASGPDGYLDFYDFDRKAVVLSAIGALAGKTWRAKGKWSCIKNTIRFFSRNEALVLTDYLYWVTSQPNFWPRRGAAQPFIAKSDADAILIPLPPLEVQREIVSILDKLDALVNDITYGLPAEIEARRKQYEYYRNKLLTFKELDAA